MKLVYKHDNPVLVGLAKGLLENAGLEVTIKNEFWNTGLTYHNRPLELFVLNDNDFETAITLLEDMIAEEGKDS